jgi:hypothetical protein
MEECENRMILRFAKKVERVPASLQDSPAILPTDRIITASFTFPVAQILTRLLSRRF